MRWLEIIAVDFVEAIFGQKSDQCLEVIKVVLERGTRGKAGVGVGVWFNVELEAVGLISSKELEPGNAWSVIVGKSPTKVTEIVSDTDEVIVMFLEPVITGRDGPEPDRSSTVALGVCEVGGNVELGRGRRSAREELEPLGVVLLELFVGLEHGDDEVMYAPHKTAVGLVAEREPVGKVDGGLVVLLNASISDGVSSFVTFCLIFCAQALLNVLGLGVALDFREVGGMRRFGEEGHVDQQMEIAAGLNGPLLPKFSVAVVPLHVYSLLAMWVMVISRGGGKSLELNTSAHAGFIVDSDVAGAVGSKSNECSE